MAKILLLVAVCAAVYFVVRGYARSIARTEAGRKSGESGEEDMVRCQHCGVHLPRSESAQADDAFFCSEEHRRLHEPPA